MLNEKRKIQNKRKIIISIIFLIIIIGFASAYSKTGIFQKSEIDSRDLATWNYNEKGEILDTNEFAKLGQRDKCWILIHSYTATPQEMAQLSESINAEFDDLVHAVKLSGHGEIPSNLLDKNLDIWYSQVERRFDSFDSVCSEINVVGSSFGSVLALRLAQERNVSNLYILNPFLGKSYEPHKIFPFKTRTKLYSDFFVYKKKDIVGEINFPAGREHHIAYLNMPYAPIKNSLDFIDLTISDLNKVKNSIFIAYSENN
tara:strand:- start:46 stop:819 length:774 start_codon:yes stop_codon:yes gene_type:complete